VRLIRMAIYLGAEFLCVYTLLVGSVFAFFWFGTGLPPVVQLIFAFFALISIPLCAVAVLVGPAILLESRAELLLEGAYRPWRPLALLGWVGHASGANRQTVQLHFAASGAVTATDVMIRLSEQLRRDGIAHACTASILVHDEGVTWGVAPDLTAPTLTVWADSNNPAFRRQIFDGVRQFMTGTLGLTPA